MLRLVAFPLALCLCLSASAQGTFTYRFDWHGFSNFFQAAFTLTQEDFNGQFQSDLFLSSMDVTTPLGRHYHEDDHTTVQGDGRMLPWGLSFLLTDWNDLTQIDIYGASNDAIGGVPQKGRDRKLRGLPTWNGFPILIFILMRRTHFETV